MCAVAFKLPLGSSLLQLNGLFRNRLHNMCLRQALGPISEAGANDKTEKKCLFVIHILQKAFLIVFHDDEEFQAEASRQK